MKILFLKLCILVLKMKYWVSIHLYIRMIVCTRTHPYRELSHVTRQHHSLWSGIVLVRANQPCYKEKLYIYSHFVMHKFIFIICLIFRYGKYPSTIKNKKFTTTTTNWHKLCVCKNKIYISKRSKKKSNSNHAILL